MKVFELKRERSETLTKARATVQKAIDESRDLSADEGTQVADLRKAAEDFSRKIELFELRDSFDATGGRLGPGDGARAGLPDLENYSLLRAIRMQVEVREGKPGAKLDGLEAEVHQELAKTKAEGSEVRGILVPWSLASHRRQFGLERRDVTTTTAAGSIANILGTDLIDYLRNRMVMNTLGARTMSGLTGGSFALPKQLTTTTAYYVSEGTALTNSNLTIGQVVWTPRTLGARTQITRKTLLQSSLDVEALVRQDVVMMLAREFDRVGVNGSGQNSQPMGILQDPNVPTTAINTNGGVPTWAMVVALETQVATSNADFGSLAYLTSNKARGKMKTTTKIASSQYSNFLWDNDQAGTGMGTVNGYRAMASEQVPSALTKGSLTTASALIFGNFESATYGLWSGVDIVVDPYTAASSGAIVINAFQDFDFQVRWEQSFAKCVDIDTTP